MSKRATPGILFIIAAPSGGGKTSLVNKLLASDSQLKLSISHTTRSMRKGEINGRDYFFVTPDIFEKMVESNAFLEHATVFDSSYGTSTQQVMSSLNEGFDVILEIDWQGAQQVRKLFEHVASIFILPPSYEVLEMRLSQRGQDSKEVIAARMKKAYDEMSHCEEFDYIVLKDDFDLCLEHLKAIV